MKKIILNLFAIGMIAGFSNSLNAQITNTASATSPAYATIVAPIGITHTNGTDLEFGTIISGAGAVTVSTAGVRTFSNADLNPGDQGESPTSGQFYVSGEADYTYSIAFTNATEDLTETASATMTAGSFLASTLIDGEGLTGTLNASGDDTIEVGATLTVTAGLPSGLYTGSFEVTVAYN